MIWPSRRTERAELLDNPRIDDAIRVRALGEVERSNAYFGGNRVVRHEVRNLLRQWPSGRMTVLDIGTGAGGIAALIRAEGRRGGVRMSTIGIDLCPALARAAHRAGTPAVCGDGLCLPFGDNSVDLVLCSQLLHHFRQAEAVRLLRELTRVARHRVIVADLRRSWIAAGGFWLASHVLGFHPVTRHDGVTSVLRGFTADELAKVVGAATGQVPAVKRRLAFRLVGSWTPSESPQIR